MWLTKLKTALVLKDIDSFSSLVDEMPIFETLEEMEQAAYLLQQLKTLLEEEKSQTVKIMHQIKNTLDFLNSTQINQPTSINLKF